MRKNKEKLPEDIYTFINSVCYTCNCVVHLIWHATLQWQYKALHMAFMPKDVASATTKDLSIMHRKPIKATYRFRNKTNRSGPVKLWLNNIVDCSRSVTNLESSRLDASNSSRTKNNLKAQVRKNTLLPADTYVQCWKTNAEKGMTKESPSEHSFILYLIVRPCVGNQLLGVRLRNTFSYYCNNSNCWLF